LDVVAERMYARNAPAVIIEDHRDVQQLATASRRPMMGTTDQDASGARPASEASGAADGVATVAAGVGPSLRHPR
jgi:hypothetical protein